MAFAFRSSSLAERQEFYEKEFSILKVKKWFKKNKMTLPQICAVDAGTETGVIINKKLKNQMLYFTFKELNQKIKKYIPEDVYYDRSIYKNPEAVLTSLKFNEFVSQELMFDIDFDNVSSREKKVDDNTIKKAYFWALKLKKELKNQFNFKNVELVYSGRGFHIYVHDKKAREMNFRRRDKTAKNILKLKYPIDEWVTKGYIRLARMPYSLNALVSRKVIPIKNKFSKKEAIPKFLLE